MAFYWTDKFMAFRHLETCNFNDIEEWMGEGMGMSWYNNDFIEDTLLPRINKNINTIFITIVPTKQRTR